MIVSPRLVLKAKLRSFVGFLFILPCLILFILVLGYPIFFAIHMSFYRVDLNFTYEYIGLENFLRALHDKWFWNSVRNTMIYTSFSVLFTFLGGFVVALELNNQAVKKLRPILQTAVLIPWTISFVVTGALWRWILNSSYGIINALLRSLKLIEENLSFLGDPRYAMGSVVFVNTWRMLPFAMIMLYAGLQLVPDDQIEAAKVDGANPIQLFWYITIPNLKGVIAVTITLLSIWNFIQFDLVYVLTGGGPNRATELLSNLIYKLSFQYYDFGYGSAVAVFVLLLVAIMTLVYMKILEF